MSPKPSRRVSRRTIVQALAPGLVAVMLAGSALAGREDEELRPRPSAPTTEAAPAAPPAAPAPAAKAVPQSPARAREDAPAKPANPAPPKTEAPSPKSVPPTPPEPPPASPSKAPPSSAPPPATPTVIAGGMPADYGPALLAVAAHDPAWMNAQFGMYAWQSVVHCFGTPPAATDPELPWLIEPPAVDLSPTATILELPAQVGPGANHAEVRFAEDPVMLLAPEGCPTGAALSDRWAPAMIVLRPTVPVLPIDESTLRDDPAREALAGLRKARPASVRLRVSDVRREISSVGGSAGQDVLTVWLRPEAVEVAGIRAPLSEAGVRTAERRAFAKPQAAASFTAVELTGPIVRRLVEAMAGARRLDPEIVLAETAELKALPARERAQASKMLAEAYAAAFGSGDPAQAAFRLDHRVLVRRGNRDEAILLFPDGQRVGFSLDPEAPLVGIANAAELDHVALDGAESALISADGRLEVVLLPAELVVSPIGIVPPSDRGPAVLEVVVRSLTVFGADVGRPVLARIDRATAVAAKAPPPKDVRGFADFSLFGLRGRQTEADVRAILDRAFPTVAVDPRGHFLDGYQGTCNLTPADHLSAGERAARISAGLVPRLEPAAGATCLRVHFARDVPEAPVMSKIVLTKTMRIAEASPRAAIEALTAELSARFGNPADMQPIERLYAIANPPVTPKARRLAWGRAFETAEGADAHVLEAEVEVFETVALVRVTLSSEEAPPLTAAVRRKDDLAMRSKSP